MLEIGIVLAAIGIFGYLVYTKRSIKEAQQDTLEIIAGLSAALKATSEVANEAKKLLDEQKKAKETDPNLH